MPHEASRTIHGYTMIRLLGDGAFGEVWEALAPGGHPAAVKLIDYTRSQAAAQLELDALEVLKSLKHPYLLPTYASYIDADQVVIAMELADGTLRQRLQFCRNEGRPGLPVGELLHYIRQAGDALDYLHSQKKLHRDVKPDNLLLFHGPPPFVKVGDCGLLREHADSDETMTSLGTPPYMPLEVWRRNACSQSDLYSLAVTYAELRQGKRPYNAAPGMSLFDAQLTQEPDLAGLEEAEKEVVRKALARDPQQRHDNCLEFVEALERAMQVRPGRFRPAEPVGLVPPKVKELKTPAAPMPRPHLTLREDSHGTLGTHMPGRTREQPVVAAPSLTPEEDSWPPEDTERTKGVEQISRSKRPPTPAAPPTPPGTPITTWVAVGLVLAALCGVGYLARGVFLGNRDVVTPVEKDPNLASKEINKGKNQPRPNGKADDEKGKQPAEVIVPPIKPKDDKPKPPVPVKLWLPPEYKPLNEAETEAVAGRGKLYRGLVREYKGASVVLRLVSPQKDENGPPFYLMENKVSNRLYRSFGKDGLWKLGGKKDFGKDDVGSDDGDLPVLRITRAEAAAFAVEIGGQLPTAAQLDRAAVRGEDRPNPPKKAAVNRADKGPRKVTDADNDDVSRAGVRDLLGNGREWTRDDVNGTKFAVLRGQMYTAQEALRESELQKQLVGDHMTPRQAPDHASPYTGFRMVVEVPEQERKD